MPTKPSKKLLEYWFTLYNKGVELDTIRLEYLKESGLVERFAYEEEETFEEFIEKKSDIPVFETPDEEELKVIVPGIKKRSAIISRKDWLPHDENVFKPEPEFVEFIDSTFLGFSKKKDYEKYELYKQQAYQWLEESEPFPGYDADIYVQINFVRQERRKMQENTLYYLLRELYMSEGQSYGGRRRFKPYDCQSFIAYLIDCGFSLIIAKLRQVGFSTVIGAILEIKMQLHNGYFIKFITENVVKAEEIFETKIKFSLYAQQPWLKPTVSNDSNRELQFQYKDKKGASVVGGKMLVEAPYPTAINGGSPDIVGIDEAGNIPILQKIITQGRPTMFRQDENGKSVMCRQVIIYGTGGEQDRGGGVFEAEYRSAQKAWKERDFEYGIIPIFIDCYSKPSITKEDFESKKRFYLRRAAEDPNGSEGIMTEFRQTYPTCIEDVFLRSNKTIIPIEVINRHIDRIYALPDEQKPLYGYFVPLFNNAIPTPDEDLPYKISGVVFKETGFGSPDSVIKLYRIPEKGWLNRYYEGIDPINQETGNSLFSASIWDALTNSKAASLNFRVQDYKYCYLQALLLGLYYDWDGIKNLIEYNIGSGYIDYVTSKGLSRTLTYNKMLPKYMQTGTSQYGITKKRGMNPIHIVNKLVEMLDGYADNIDDEEFWLQLKNFVQKVSAKTGTIKWAPASIHYHHDDDIDATIYSYINACCYSSRPPISTKQQEEHKKFKKHWRCDASTGWHNILVKQQDRQLRKK
jgi:hypothetical protein